MVKSPPRKGKGKWATGPQPPDRSALVPQGSRQGNFQPPDVNGGEDLLVKQATDQAYVAAGVPQEMTSDEERLAKLKALIQEAESTYSQYGGWIQKGWQRAYRAFGNRHFDGSKYLAKEFKARSSLFVPKTRSAVRKMMAAATASLFSTQDAMAITAGNEGDERARAGAALVQEIVNYRTDRTSGRNAIKWFLTCMGCVQDATLTSICVSKQFWKLEEKIVGEEPMLDPNGEPIIDGETGEPVTTPIKKKIMDRPESVGIPPDQIIIDGGADWRDPAQTAGFLGIKWPMTVDEIIKNQKSPQDPWKPIPEERLKSFVGDGSNSLTGRATRTAREGGRDRYDQGNRPEQFGTIWVTEWFVRFEGEDYTFNTVGQGEEFLTDPRLVEEVYPWNFGDRPVVMGYGSLESHKIFSMSPAESWQQTQVEINDISNLTLDTVKMNIAPIAVLKRGANVDLDALRRRGPGTTVLADNVDNIVFEKPPGADPGAWKQREVLNQDFDSLAGQFDQASVATNRSMNETVGGMKILSGAANALGEFDQRVIIETWAEPALAQIVRLCQFYEQDETILGLCGERAKLWQKYKIDEITDELLESQVTTRIDIGVGAGDPQQRLQKFQMATAVLLPVLQNHPDFQKEKIKLSVKAMFKEAFGAAGYRDGGERFIEAGDAAQQNGQQQPQENPDVIKAKGEIQLKKERQDAELEMDRQKAKDEADLKRQVAKVDAMLKREMQQNDLANQAQQAQGKLALDGQVQKMSMDAQNGLEREKFGASHQLDREKASAGQGLEREKFQAGHGLEREKANAGFGLDKEKADRSHQLDRGKADRSHQLETVKADRGHQLEVTKAEKGHALEQTKAGKSHELAKETAGKKAELDRDVADKGHSIKKDQATKGHALDRENAEHSRRLAEEDHKAKLKQGEEAHKVKVKQTEAKAKDKSKDKFAAVEKEVKELQAAIKALRSKAKA